MLDSERSGFFHRFFGKLQATSHSFDVREGARPAPPCTYIQFRGRQSPRFPSFCVKVASWLPPFNCSGSKRRGQHPALYGRGTFAASPLGSRGKEAIYSPSSSPLRTEEYRAIASFPQQSGVTRPGSFALQWEKQGGSQSSMALAAAQALGSSL